MPSGSTDQPIAETRCRATIVRRGASVRATVQVTVFDDHLRMREPGVGSWTVCGAEIRSLTHQITPLRGPALAIEHAVPDLGSSIALTLVPDHPVRQAIVKIRRDIPRPPGIPSLELASFWTGAFILGPVRLWRLRRAQRVNIK
jgi:hypothetical protein